MRLSAGDQSPGEVPSGTALRLDSGEACRPVTGAAFGPGPDPTQTGVECRVDAWRSAARTPQNQCGPLRPRRVGETRSPDRTLDF